MRGAVLKEASPGFWCFPGKTIEIQYRRLSLAIGTSGVGRHTENGGLSYWTSAIFGPDDSSCALVAGSRFDGGAGSSDRTAASGDASWGGRRAAFAGSTITFAPIFTRS